MYLKKIHNVEKGKSVGIAGIEVKFAPKGVRKLSQRWVDEGIQEGWLTFGKGKMSVGGVDGESVLDLNVVRVPGHYCCHCEAKLPSDPQARDVVIDKKTYHYTTGQEHVHKEHQNAPSPDPQNPAGYRWETFYTVVNPGEVDNMTKEDAAEFEKHTRGALHDRIFKSMKAAKKAG